MAKGKEKKIRANTYGMRVMRELFFAGSLESSYCWMVRMIMNIPINEKD